MYPPGAVRVNAHLSLWLEVIIIDPDTGLPAHIGQGEIMARTHACTLCGSEMLVTDERWVLLPETDVPAHGSRTEIMITPGKTLRVGVLRCSNPECGHLEFIEASRMDSGTE